jgi:fido (protein-threonine AMPylation protein)
MDDWDEDGSQLRANLARVILSAHDESISRASPSIAAVRQWHSEMLAGLAVPSSKYAGRFRGEDGLQGIGVKIGDHYGVRSDLVAAALAQFEQTLQSAVANLDEQIKPGQDLTADQLAAVIDLCAWVHSEWIRIHPFANGNGRTARLWANYIAMRYGLPVFVRLRPRPGNPYDMVAADAMEGRWQSTVPVFREMYADYIRRRTE